MLAILDPELRHSKPSRRQSAALIGSLAMIAIVVGAAAPAPRASETKMRVATQAPGVDPQFVPRDVPEKECCDKSLDRDIDKSADKSLERILGKRLDKDIGKAVDKSLDNSLNTTITNSVQTSTHTVVDNITQEAIRQSTSFVGKNLGNIVGSILSGRAPAKTDDRPALLANILRTDSDPQLRRTAA